MIDAYLGAYPDMTAEHALSNLMGQESRIRLMEAVGSRGDSMYAGAWFDAVTGMEHLAVTDPALVDQYKVLAHTFQVDAEVHLYEFSAATLVPVARSVNAGADPVLGSAGINQASVDFEANAVIVRVSDELLSRLAQGPLLPTLHPAIQLEVGEQKVDSEDVCTTRYSCGAPLRGGVVITRVADTPQCSLGYTASATDGSRWAITAGHCETVLNSLWRAGEQVIGPVRQSGDAAEVDIARIHMNRSYWLQSGGGWLYDYYQPNVPANLTLSITQRTTISVDEVVCLDAAHSVPSAVCGVINRTYGLRNMPEVGFDACPGDSGGSWFFRPPGSSSRWAYGVHHGGSLSCHAASGYSTFTAVPDMNAYFDGTAAARIRIEVHP